MLSPATTPAGSNVTEALGQSHRHKCRDGNPRIVGRNGNTKPRSEADPFSHVRLSLVTIRPRIET